jgi:hypothetical protein
MKLNKKNCSFILEMITAAYLIISGCTLPGPAYTTSNESQMKRNIQSVFNPPGKTVSLTKSLLASNP